MSHIHLNGKTDLSQLPVEAIVGALTDAHRSFLLLLPSDGSWQRTSSRDFDRHGPNAFRGFGKSGLIDGYYQEEMRHRLTPLGQEVQQALLAIPAEAAA